MKLVKRSLYLCIGVLILLAGLQGAQSLWQTWRLANAAEQLVQSNLALERAQALWSAYVAAEEAFREAGMFSDVERTRILDERFSQSAARLRDAVREFGATGVAGAPAIASKVEGWLEMAGRHVGAAGAPTLPSYHLLDRSHEELAALIEQERVEGHRHAAVAVEASRGAYHQAMAWTGIEMLAAAALGTILGAFALRALHLQLGADAAEVARVANAVAEGDLTIPIDTRGVPEGSVMAATAKMQRALIATVLRVREISDGLSTGVHEIAAGNHDMSVRTEHQAAALERTASTVEELSATVRNNAVNASQASGLAGTASGAAQQGGAVVSEAVATMRAINESSQKIADIVAIIDGIAFQTNILALNAAVEAARAGQHGRGFAVVAGEVRLLAQRSATAAKEVKVLIDDSVCRVGEGTVLMEKVGASMGDVVASIRRVDTVMSEISTSCSEQSEGVSQVGHAITDLDRVTQQNAALAEQSAAAASTLNERGRELVEAMSFFCLPCGHGA